GWFGASAEAHVPRRDPQASAARAIASGSRPRANAWSFSLPAWPSRIHARVAAAEPRSRAIGIRLRGEIPRRAESTRSAGGSWCPEPYPAGHTAQGPRARASDRTFELRHRRGRAIRERLDDMVRFDEVRSREVRNRPRDLERAIEPATRDRVEVDRRREELARVRRDPC